MHRIYLIFLTSLLSGCLIIPAGLPGREPYDKDTIADLGTQNLDREGIRASMGQPDVVRGNGTIWTYGKPQDITELWGIMVYMMTALDINNYFVVVVEFTDDTAHHIELLDLGWDKTRGCTTTGICVNWVTAGKGVNKLNSEYVVVSAKPEDDAAAKRFESVEGMCSVYLFTDLDSYVSIDMGQNTLIAREDYIHTLLQPGFHKISGKVLDLDLAKTLHCSAGIVSFYKLTTKNESYLRRKSLIKQIGYDAGTKKISKRHLVISR